MKKLLSVLLIFVMLLTSASALAEDAVLSTTQSLVDYLEQGDIEFRVWMDQDGDEWVTIPVNLENWNKSCDIDCIFFSDLSSVAIAVFDLIEMDPDMYDTADGICYDLYKEHGDMYFWADEDDYSVDVYYTKSLKGVSDVGETVTGIVVDVIELVEGNYDTFAPVLSGEGNTAAASAVTPAQEDADDGPVSLDSVLVGMGNTPEGFVHVYNDILIGEYLRWQLSDADADTIDSLTESFSLTYDASTSAALDMSVYSAPLGFYMAFQCADTDSEFKQITFIGDFEGDEDYVIGSAMNIVSVVSAMILGADSEQCAEISDWSFQLLDNEIGMDMYESDLLIAFYMYDEDTGYYDILFELQ